MFVLPADQNNLAEELFILMVFYWSFNNSQHVKHKNSIHCGLSNFFPTLTIHTMCKVFFMMKYM